MLAIWQRDGQRTVSIATLCSVSDVDHARDIWGHFEEERHRGLHRSVSETLHNQPRSHVARVAPFLLSHHDLQIHLAKKTGRSDATPGQRTHRSGDPCANFLNNFRRLPCKEALQKNVRTCIRALRRDSFESQMMARDDNRRGEPQHAITNKSQKAQLFHH